MNNLIPIFVAIPLGTAFVLAMLFKLNERVSDVLANIATFSLLCLSLRMIPILAKYGYFIYKIGGWAPPFGINFVLDGLSLFMLIVVSIVSFFASFYSISYMEHYTDKPRYYAIFLLMIAGMNGIILTGDLFNLFVFIEIASIASYALVGFGTQHEELEAAFKYMVMGEIASLLILLGVILLYSGVGSVNMADIGVRIQNPEYKMQSLIRFVSILFIFGFGLKAALIPFHAWLPDAHPSAPAPISCMLSGLLIKALGVYALIRVFYCIFGVNLTSKWILLTLGAVSMVVGALLAIPQDDFKRMLAYSSISQVGYIIIGVASGSPLGIIGGLFHLANHATFKGLLFLNSGSVEVQTRTRDLNKMGGLSKVMPITSGSCLIGSLSISGIPPFNGFWSKLFIIIGLVQGGHIALGVLATMVAVITLAYYLRIQRLAFWGKARRKFERIKESPWTMCFAMISLAIICLGAGIFYPWIKDVVLNPAVEVITQGTNYGIRVLSLVQ
ncbi:MAG: monovalent cation/H+ antiporter subunit D family protein [bacterium]|nr:monovalent cation/H+ antiporter subunit D family protein [bacterium]